MNAAFSTLWEALVTVCRLLAPIAPFASDWIHREIASEKSVHLERYPQSEGREDEELDAAMELARQISGLGRAAREAAAVRVRQPLRRLFAAVPGRRSAVVSEDVLEVVRDELNVKEITFVDDAAELLTYRAEPNFAVLGPEFGARAQAVAEVLKGLDGAELAAWRSRGGALSVEVSGEKLEVPESAVTLAEESRNGLAVQSDSGVVVGLDVVVDDELRAEGTARELVNRIQRLRREVGLELDDRIRLGIFGAPEVASAADTHRDYIASEVLAVDVEIGPPRPAGGGYDHTQEIRLDGREAMIAVQVD
jgi:isoleucyl-tRNA synthetase